MNDINESISFYNDGYDTRLSSECIKEYVKYKKLGSFDMEVQYLINFEKYTKDKAILEIVNEYIVSKNVDIKMYINNIIDSFRGKSKTLLF